MLELKVQLFSFLSSKSYSKDWRAKGMQQRQVSGSRASKLEKLMKQSSGQCTPLAKARISEWNISGTSSWGQPVSPSTPLLWANWKECPCARQAWGQKYLHNTFLPKSYSLAVCWQVQMARSQSPEEEKTVLAEPVIQLNTSGHHRFPH